MRRSIAFGALLGALLAVPQLNTPVPVALGSGHVFGLAICLFGFFAPQFIARRNSMRKPGGVFSVFDTLHRYVDLYALLTSFTMVIGVGGVATLALGNAGEHSAWPYLYFVSIGAGLLVARPKDGRFGTGDAARE